MHQARLTVSCLLQDDKKNAVDTMYTLYKTAPASAAFNTTMAFSVHAHKVVEFVFDGTQVFYDPVPGSNCSGVI